MTFRNISLSRSFRLQLVCPGPPKGGHYLPGPPKGGHYVPGPPEGGQCVPGALAFALATAALFLFGTPATGQDTTGVGAITGIVVDAAGAPAEGVRVCALDTAACVTSDAQGAFRIGELRAGSYRLEILPLDGLPFTSDAVDVRAGLDGAVEITLPRGENFQETVTVTAPAFQAAEEVKNSGFLVAPREILKSAAALQDVSRYVQGLPGVTIGPTTSATTSSSAAAARSKTCSSSTTLRDSQHQRLCELRLRRRHPESARCRTPAGCDLSHRRLSRPVYQPHVQRAAGDPARGESPGVGGWATLGFAGAGVILEGPINAGKGSWVVSSRRSFLDLFTQDVGFGGVPVVYAINAKAVYDLTPRDRVWMVNVAGVDEIRLGLSESSDLEDEIANFDIRYDGWRSATGFNWQRIFGSRGVGLFGVTHSEAKVGQQVKDLVAQGAPPPNLSPEEVIARSPVVYFEDSREGESTIKYDLTVHLPFFDTGPKRRQFQDVPHQLHGGIALWQRHTLLTCARHRPLFSRHTLPIVPKRVDTCRHRSS